MGEKKENNSYFDIATIISVVGIAIYILGYIYWKYFFQTLNISQSFIDLSFDKIIVTTWPLLFIVILGFSTTFLQIIWNDNGEIDIVSVIFIIISGLLTTLYLIIKYNYFLLIILIFFIIFSIFKFLVHKRKLAVENIKIKTLCFILLGLIYLIGIFYYKYIGIVDAEKILKNYEINCHLILNNQENIEGKFIVKTEKKIFLLTETDRCEKQIISISEEDVIKIIFPLKLK